MFRKEYKEIFSKWGMSEGLDSYFLQLDALQFNPGFSPCVGCSHLQVEETPDRDCPLTFVCDNGERTPDWSCYTTAEANIIPIGNEEEEIYVLSVPEDSVWSFVSTIIQIESIQNPEIISRLKQMCPTVIGGEPVSVPFIIITYGCYVRGYIWHENTLVLCPCFWSDNSQQISLIIYLQLVVQGLAHRATEEYKRERLAASKILPVRIAGDLNCLLLPPVQACRVRDGYCVCSSPTHCGRESVLLIWGLFPFFNTVLEKCLCFHSGLFDNPDSETITIIKTETGFKITNKSIDPNNATQMSGFIRDSFSIQQVYEIFQTWIGIMVRMGGPEMTLELDPLDPGERVAPEE